MAGRLEADVEIWNGPNDTPCKIRIFSEDGRAYPFRGSIETPHSPSTVAIRNIGEAMMVPVEARVDANDVDGPSPDCLASPAAVAIPRGDIKAYTFDASVEGVQCLLGTEGWPLNGRIELLQGDDEDVRQVIELYTENGRERPFFCVIEMPGTGNVVRVINTATIESNVMIASIVPHSILVEESLSSDFAGDLWAGMRMPENPSRAQATAVAAKAAAAAAKRDYERENFRKLQSLAGGRNRADWDPARHLPSDIS